MLSGATKEALTSVPDDLVYVEDVELRGRRASTSIWSIAEPDAGAERADDEPTGVAQPETT